MARWRNFLRVAIFVFSFLTGFGATAQTGHTKHVSLADLCVTEGTITTAPAHRLLVNAPSVHATLNRETPPDIEAHFVYLGPSIQNEAAEHASGHHQFGFQLFTEDPCNLLYVMWRLEPESSIAVMAKSNPEHHAHADCRGRGKAIEPEFTAPLPPVRVGERRAHTLRATMSGTTLLVYADKLMVWRGALPAASLRAHGLVGIHCDNAKLEVMLTVAAPAANAPVVSCPTEH